MSKPRSRSRQYNRENNVVDFDQARKRRAERREQETRSRQKERREELSPRQKKKRTRQFVFYLAAFLILVLVIGIASINVIQLEREKSTLEKKNTELTQELEKKESELANSDDPEYVEKLVREKLHMVYPGEILYLKKDEDVDTDGKN